MKYSSWPVVKLAIGDEEIAMEQDNGSMHVGTTVWPCSLVLAKWAERQGGIRERIQGKRGIELGAGCGGAGLALALLGLGQVLLTDVPPVLSTLKRNVKKNVLATSLSSKKKVKVAQLNWGNKQQIESLKPPFDVVIAADVVYIENGVEPLLQTMGDVSGPDSLILLGYQVRSPEAHELFWRLCPERFAVDKVDRSQLHPDYAFEEADVYILKKKC
ncbi:protein N-lysine methyltransferase METTL21A [Selaginella moellendorffii]|uniref:protein N-lysine methyltransferase METTL21A n=1 Tax=Selaginella moellendorffii TaxID=88036 RepID=UPI000D1CC5D7|nr:protein N-lysine methyltransferase METTL21A [Selaginella moellendorffii]|eukprot:XP_024543365.1 protein N-lysine methyltransferase METTL21A [Selaginella moellendorffii]